MVEIQKKRICRLLLVTAACCAGGCVVLFVFLRTGVSVQCPFHLLTGLSCPGCGNTRAAAALIRLRFAESLRYNYAYPAEFLYIIRAYCLAAIRYVREGKFSYAPKHPAADYAFLGLLLAWWAARNLLGM